MKYRKTSKKQWKTKKNLAASASRRSGVNEKHRKTYEKAGVEGCAATLKYRKTLKNQWKTKKNLEASERVKQCQGLNI